MKAILTALTFSIVFFSPRLIAAVEHPQAWGDQRGISNAQAVSVLYLAWPQSYGAMVDLLGYPDARDSRADWYRLSRDRWLIVRYRGAQAVGYQWRN